MLRKKWLGNSKHVLPILHPSTNWKTLGIKMVGREPMVDPQEIMVEGNLYGINHSNLLSLFHVGESSSFTKVWILFLCEVTGRTAHQNSGTIGWTTDPEIEIRIGKWSFPRLRWHLFSALSQLVSVGTLRLPSSLKLTSPLKWMVGRLVWPCMAYFQGAILVSGRAYFQTPLIS